MRLKSYICSIYFLLTAICVVAGGRYERYNVIWDSQSENSWGSMPAGNGDISTNSWVNKNGDLEVYIGKTDAFSEINRLLKIGKLTIKTTPSLLDSENFMQQLDIESGIIHIKGVKWGDSIDLKLWVDANRPIIHIEGRSSKEVKVEITNNIWRTVRREIKDKERHSAYGLYSAPYKIYSEPDTVVDTESAITWYHHNRSSIFRATLENQNIAEFASGEDDPLLNNIFGAIVQGAGMKKEGKNRLISIDSTKNIDIRICVNSLKNSNPEVWISNSENLMSDSQKQSLSAARKKHTEWWHKFWNNHYLFIDSKESPKETFTITQSYILQRYINACAGRGNMPIKFNGSIFTVDLQENLGAGGQKGFDADYREWGGPYWWQNTRLPYYTMLYSGDYQMMKPLFDMYLKALPLAKYRTQKYFNHKGAYFPETFCFWGTYCIDNYGWQRDSTLSDGVSQNNYIRYYFQSNIEVVSMMLDYYLFSQDKEFINATLLPFAKEVILFFDQHYAKDADGKINITPSQSLETYFEGVVNPLPDIAGLKWVLTRLNNMCVAEMNDSMKAIVERLLLSLPEFPTASQDGKRYLVAGYNLGERKNVEKPELYALFPYRWYGVGMPDLECAIETYDRRAVKEFWGWQQDGIFAANLGLTQEAQRVVTSNFSVKHKGSRFPAFWGPNYDWVPDQDHGCVTMRALQNMLIQHDDNTLHLFAAWPEDWSVEFKVHTPLNGYIKGSYSAEKGVRIDKQKIPRRFNVKVYR